MFAMLAMNYLGTMQCAFTWENGSKFIYNTYFCAPAVIFAALVYTRSTGLVKRAQKY
jgi:predicted alpha-1,6-mannanase (GH76 family)